MTQEFVVTNGSVEYKHSKPLGDYDNKTPVVTLHYQIAEGSDPALATAKVMGIAMEIVERAIATNVTVQQAAAEPVPETPVVRRGRPPVNPTPSPEATNKDTVVSAVFDPVTQPDPTAIVDEAEPEVKPVTEPDPTDMAGVDSADEDADLGIVPVVSDKDLQAQAQKISSHLRTEFGNINDLRKLIAVCNDVGGDGGGNGTLLTIPQDKRIEFMQKSRGLLAMKK